MANKLIQDQFRDALGRLNPDDISTLRVLLERHFSPGCVYGNSKILEIIVRLLFDLDNGYREMPPIQLGPQQEDPGVKLQAYK